MLERSLPDASHSPVRLEDHLLWLDDRNFLPTGRRDNAVQVGGVNVYPARIAAKIQSLPEIAACAVRPLPNKLASCQRIAPSDVFRRGDIVLQGMAGEMVNGKTPG